MLRPRKKQSLGQLKGWVGVTHVRRRHEHSHTRGGGHLPACRGGTGRYQGRFKSFPTQDDRHFLTLCRSVEANALRAGLVERAEDWPWSGLAARRRRGREDGLVLPCCPWPVDRPSNWKA